VVFFENTFTIITDAATDPQRMAAVVVTPAGAIQTFSWLVARKTSINVLEARAFQRALHCSQSIARCNVVWVGDNTSALNAVKRTYSPAFDLNRVVDGIMTTIAQRQIHVFPLWVPSEQNPADGPSRGKQLTEDDWVDIKSWASLGQRAVAASGSGGVMAESGLILHSISVPTIIR
jgi:hypothetical protein